MHPLQQHIAQCTQQTVDFDTVLDFFEATSFPKRYVLLRAGEVCRFEGFVLEGCVKTYFIEPNGAEVILTFATENWWVSDLVSFEEQKPARFYIETLEDTEMLLLDRSSKAALLEKFPQLERMFRLMVQRHLASYQNRLYETVSLTAEERYAHFIAQFPDLLQRVPQYQIAAYLGMSPEFLSKIRRRQAQG